MVQRKGKRSQCFFSLVWLQLALPHCDTVPSHLCQLPLLFLVPLFVTPDLLLPKVRIRLRHPEVLATIMSMPKATVDKHARAILAQHNIRMARKTRIIQPITKTMLPQIMTHKNLRLRILRANSSHILMSLLCSEFHTTKIQNNIIFTHILPRKKISFCNFASKQK